LPDTILENIINNYMSIVAATITLSTIGLITIITIIAYALERRITSDSPLYQRLLAHILEGLILALSMVMLQRIFQILNHSSINNAWLYANAQLTILLYCMYLIRNKITLLINLTMPLTYYGAMNISRLNNHNLPLFVIAYLFLDVIVIYIYLKKDEIESKEWKFVIVQILFGIAWWILLWVDHSFPFFDIFNMLVVFLIYMAVIRYCERKMQSTLVNYDNLKVKVNYDELTGIRNRANLDKTSKDVYKVYSQEKDVPLTMVMFDIDHFKDFNDKYGHATGDDVLRHVAHTMEREMFLNDTKGQLFRFGGEEFIIIFRGKTPLDCIPIISDLRNHLVNSPLFLNGEKLIVHVSFGASELKDTDTNFSDLFKRVDQNLYDSKNAGRNRMTVDGVTYTFDKN